MKKIIFLLLLFLSNKMFAGNIAVKDTIHLIMPMIKSVSLNWPSNNEFPVPKYSWKNYRNYWAKTTQKFVMNYWSVNKLPKCSKRLMEDEKRIKSQLVNLIYGKLNDNFEVVIDSNIQQGKLIDSIESILKHLELQSISTQNNDSTMNVMINKMDTLLQQYSNKRCMIIHILSIGFSQAFFTRALHGEDEIQIIYKPKSSTNQLKYYHESNSNVGIQNLYDYLGYISRKCLRITNRKFNKSTILKCGFWRNIKIEK